MVRLVHLSDIHVTVARLGWQLPDWYSKRLTSWIHYRWLGRRRHFRHADRVLALLIAELPRRGVDHVVFSGDATALGFNAEFGRAAELLRLGELRGLAVPGNHDYCTPAAARSGYFEQHFAGWQQGRRVGAHRYPFAQRVGDLWLIGVNAAKGNRLPWDASGRVGPEQCERLRELLRTLEPGPRVLVTHYPVCLADGRRETFDHGLRDMQAVVDSAAAGGVCLWLHGHRHGPYYFQRPSLAPFPVICAGSATQTHVWSHNEYTIEAGRLHAVRRVFDEHRDEFAELESFELDLPA
jgi:3',5'-cyclic AMP phosphodiesterase CpdA